MKIQEEFNKIDVEIEEDKTTSVEEDSSELYATVVQKKLKKPDRKKH